MNKLIIYQVLPRLFGNLNESLTHNGNLGENGAGKFSAFSPAVFARLKELGITHIWYTGVIEHATQTDYTTYGIRKDHSVIVKGKAGSPYAIKDYYDVDPDLAEDVPSRMKEFEELVKRTHEAGLKVIIDFVANHVARQYHSDACLPYIDDLGQHDNTSVAFDVNNNFYYIPGQPLDPYFGVQTEDYPYSEFPAKATGNNRFDSHPGPDDWFETIKLNYGVDYQHGGQTYFDPVPDTWHKMLNILLFWADKGVDGFRCDMAEMVPVEFWNWVIPQVKVKYDLLFIAEIYNPRAYRNYLDYGHFDYLYDKVGLYDTLRGVICRYKPAADISQTWKSTEGIQQRMLAFLENHDEQRIASDSFAGDARKGIAGMMVAAWMNTNPVMLYCGQELGEKGMDDEGYSGRDGRTTIFDYWSMTSVREWINGWTFDGKKLSAEQKELRNTYCRILNIARSEPAITQGQFYDLMYANANNPQFDLSRQYAFLRKAGTEVLLVVANFDDSEKEVAVNLPPEMFTAMGISDNKAAKVTDLLSGLVGVSTLTAAAPYRLVVPACSGRILKFAY